MINHTNKYFITVLILGLIVTTISIFVIFLPQISSLKAQIEELKNENGLLQNQLVNSSSVQNSGNVISYNENFELAPLFGKTTIKHVKIEKTTTTETRYVSYENEFSFIRGFDSVYSQIGLFNSQQKTVVIDPVFTASAYNHDGFYDYYQGKCDLKCLTVDINYNFNSFTSSGDGLKILRLLGYSIISDADVDKNPDMLKNYDKIILLHSEYVTRKEFDAITHHPQVIYLYPNSLYAEIKTDYQNNTITLIRGHGYPSNNVSNGFDWKFDNSKLEYNTDCHDWHFSKIDNGYLLNCYPEYRLIIDKYLLMVIKNL